MMVNLLLTFSMSYGLCGQTELWCGSVGQTARYQWHRLPSCAPTANRSLASKPVVMLQSAFSFASFSADFLVHLRGLHVSSTSSVHGNSYTSEVRRLSMSLLKSLHAFLLGNKTDRWLSVFLKFNKFVCNAPLNEPFLKGGDGFSSWTATAYGIQHCWKFGIFLLTLVDGELIICDVSPNVDRRCAAVTFGWSFQIQGVHWQAVAEEDHPQRACFWSQTSRWNQTALPISSGCKPSWDWTPWKPHLWWKPLHYGVWFSSPFGKLLTEPSIQLSFLRARQATEEPVDCDATHIESH